jgi:hypothetical protein
MECLVIAIILNLDLAIRLNELAKPRDLESVLGSVPSFFLEKKPWYGMLNIIFGLNLLVLLGLSFVYFSFLGVIAVWILSGISVNIIKAITGQLLWIGVHVFPVIIVILEFIAIENIK